ncbi:MAG: hypothetical protein R3E95_19500 [Thiolinea sp.]
MKKLIPLAAICAVAFSTAVQAATELKVATSAPNGTPWIKHLEKSAVISKPIPAVISNSVFSRPPSWC